MRNLDIVRMRCAVHFHHEAGVKAGKVGNEVAENDLASKAEPLDLLAPQPLPSSAFRSPLAPRLRLRARRRQSHRHGLTPHPNPPPQEPGPGARKRGPGGGGDAALRPWDYTE